MKYMAIALSALFLSACASQPERIIVRTPNQQLEIVAPATPRPPNIQEIQVDVYDKERIFEELTNNRFEPIIGMTPRNYEILLNNITESGRYIQSQQAIIRFYQNVISELQE
jgi:PBP1b-binding outer membrane lipoprotein LpoB